MIHKLKFDLKSVCWLAFFSFFGNLIRWGLASLSLAILTSDPFLLTEQPSPVMYKDLMANLLGCFMMGILAQHQDEFAKAQEMVQLNNNQEFSQFNPNTLLISGYSTGFLGTITTWSGFIFAISRGFWYAPGQSVVSIFITITACYGSFLFGKSAATPKTLMFTYSVWLKMENYIVYLAIGFWLLLLTLAIVFNIPIFWILTFAPLGTMLRFFFSSKILIPWGTFTSNLLGSTLMILFYIFHQLTGSQYFIFIGLAGGFAGSLTTVSTFISEIDKLLKLFELERENPHIIEFSNQNSPNSSTDSETELTSTPEIPHRVRPWLYPLISIISCVSIQCIILASFSLSSSPS